MDWISVRDRLPEHSVWVYGSYKSFGRKPETVIVQMYGGPWIKGLAGDEWHDRNRKNYGLVKGSFPDLQGVTHWMPPPAPPEAHNDQS